MAHKLDWYKRNPAKFIGGTVGWRWEVKCVYSVLLDLIYDGGGSCADDPSWIVNILGIGMSVRHWNLIRAELVSKGKIVVADGRLLNPVATRNLAQDATATPSPRDIRASRMKDKQGLKSRENETDLFAGKDLAPKSHPKNTTLPARARESQSQSQSQSLGTDAIVQVEQIAAVLGQPRGRYWETDYRRMIADEGLTFEDVLKAAQTHKGGALKSMNGLRGLARRMRDDRLSGDGGQVEFKTATSEDWQLALAKLGARGVWPEGKLGPMPGTDGYRGPFDLEKTFLVAWKAQGEHPLEELDRHEYFRPYPADDPDLDRRARWSRIRC